MASRLLRLEVWDYQSFVAVRAEIASFGGILAGMNWLTRRVSRIAETKTKFEILLEVFCQVTAGLVCCFWVADGLRGLRENGDHISRFLLFVVGLVGVPLCLLGSFIMILATIRKRRIETFHDSVI